jgi:curved DNA-binding protein CbpA
MHLNDEPLNLYDTLELTPDATPQEIRSAYLRLRSAYGKDNIAHYSIFSREETESMLQNIENSYLVLSNPEKRRAYDEAQGFRPTAAPAFPAGAALGSDRPVPSGDLFATTDGLNATFSSAQLASMTSSPFPEPAPPPQTIRSQTIATLQSSLDQTINDIEQTIKNEQFWTGPGIRRVREAKRITLEDLSDFTRISRTYLHALEEENYSKLPAVVYVRGFLQQVSRRLKLPGDLVTRQYLERMRTAAPEKD